MTTVSLQSVASLAGTVIGKSIMRMTKQYVASLTNFLVDLTSSMPLSSNLISNLISTLAFVTVMLIFCVSVKVFNRPKKRKSFFCYANMLCLCKGF